MQTPPTPNDFYVNFPLYKEVPFNEAENQAAFVIIHSQGPLDVYCPECEQQSIFRRHVTSVPSSYKEWLSNKITHASFNCSRDMSHVLQFWLKTDSSARTIQKVGQHPTLATLSQYDVRQYRKVLEKNTFNEFTKAIGLAAHGVGVGSFVYLRRIFEGLVEDARQEASQTIGWDEVAYGRCRMDEKIQMLCAFLPPFLVEKRMLYGILSKGIHELSEKECLAAFPAVKNVIEIILDAKIRIAAEKKKIKDASLALDALISAQADE